MYSTVHIFDIGQGTAPACQKIIEHLINCTVRCYPPPPTFWLSIRYTFKTSHSHNVLKLTTISFSLSNKIAQNNKSLNNVHCKFKTNI